MTRTSTTISLHRDGTRVTAAAFQSTDRETVCRAAASMLATVAFISPACDEARFRVGEKHYRITRERVLAAQQQDFAGIANWADLAAEIA